MYKSCPKSIIPIKNRKSEHHYWILHIRFSLGTKFQLQLIISTFWTKFVQKAYSRSKSELLKLIILIFWTKFSPKGNFRSKTEKVNITIEFCIFDFHLQLTVLIFCTKVAQKAYSQSKTEKVNITLNSACWN